MAHRLHLIEPLTQIRNWLSGLEEKRPRLTTRADPHAALVG